MATVRASAEQIIPAPAGEVYELLADYRVGHQSILPPAFSHYAVLEGGTGAGTRIRFRFRLGGRSLEAEGVVTEPEPGRAHLLLRALCPDERVLSARARRRDHPRW